jgi:hypothetical protein
MREIKFRGKRKDNGQWLEGCLVSVTPEEAFILVGITGHIKRDDYECYMLEVVPETVGQYTGLKDKNGKEIYEGDVYRSEHGPENYQVMFISGAFVGGKSEVSCMPLGWLPDDEGEEMIEESSKWIIVVGNIHDNPELVNPASGQSGINHMVDPNTPQPAEGQEATQESVSQDQAMEVDAEEGGTEG